MAGLSSHQQKIQLRETAIFDFSAWETISWSSSLKHWSSKKGKTKTKKNQKISMVDPKSFINGILKYKTPNMNLVKCCLKVPVDLRTVSRSNIKQGLKHADVRSTQYEYALVVPFSGFPLPIHRPMFLLIWLSNP